MVHNSGLSTILSTSLSSNEIVIETELSDTDPPVSGYIVTSASPENRDCRITPDGLKEDESIVSEKVISRVALDELNLSKLTSCGLVVSLIRVLGLNPND